MSFNIISIVLSILLLIVHYFVALEFYKAAAMKGWAQKKYFFLAFALWIIGYMLIIALPDRGGDSFNAILSDDLPEL